jgi:GT2 family glycosyltransferase
MYKATFVILHYETFSDTVDCINSIIKTIRFPDWNIVIVDNGSSNKSGNKLKELYEKEARIFVLLNKKNLGFARGNNEGYLFAKKTLGADFIIVINNDTIIKQADFIEKIIARYNHKRFDILGPDILSIRNGSHQNPRTEIFTNALIVKKYIRYFRYTLLLNYLHADALVIKIKKFFSPSSRLPSANTKNINPLNEEMEHVKLHGSALVFSPDFLKQSEDAFYPETFLYWEESILYHLANKKGLVSVYFPAVEIFHKEDATSDYLNKKEYKKRRFYLKHNINSAKVLLKLFTNSKI